MSKKNIIIVVLAILVVVGGGFYLNKKSAYNGYSVVYLTTGEIYVGKLTTFPDLQLKDGYILTTVADANDPKKANFQLNPLTEALWAPQNIHFIKDNVVFYSSILPESSIAKTLAEKGK